MDILTIHVDWLDITVKASNIALIVVALFLLIFHLIRRNIFGKKKRSQLTIDEVKLGIGNNTVTMRCDYRDREIAFKLWVEMSTRKIGLILDEEHDVLHEVYDSWYEFFKIARELIKNIPVHCLDVNGTSLVDVSVKVLNNCIRPHLTKWQAQYRKWYDEYAENGRGQTPQQIQKNYEHYEAMVKDIIGVNQKLIEYKNLLYNIAIGK